jgi:hypothetical protein
MWNQLNAAARPTGTAPSIRRARVRSGFVVASASVALVVAGCSSSSGTNSSTASTSAASSSAVAPVASSAPAAGTAAYPVGKEQVCAARDQIKTSLTALISPSMLTGGTAGIKTAVENVQTAVKSFVAAGKQDYAPQVSALQNALTQVQSALGTVGSGGGTASLKNVITGISAAGVAGSALLTQLKTDCGS